MTSQQPIKAGMSSSRCSHTSCATRWRRFEQRRSSSGHREFLRVSDNARVIIERQIQNMTRLIDDLLNVARITQGRIDLRLAPLDLIPLLRRAMEAVQPQVDERAQELVVSLPAEPVYVLGDATRLEQAFGNLLGNASKFTERSGRIWLTAELKRTPKGDDVFVRVRDEGIGIQPETLPHVFELFKQGGASPHRRAGPRRRPGSRPSDCGTAWRWRRRKKRRKQSRQRVCGLPAASSRRGLRF